jgi:LuxR family quorum sensing-dependent transcriptional regulator
VGDCFQTAIAAEGYNASASRAILSGRKGPQSQTFFRNWPENWARLSDQRDFGSRSPVLTYARRSVMPFTWIEANKARTMTTTEKEVWDTALEWGWFNGFVVPVHGPNGYFCCISMASRERDLDFSIERRAHLHMIALLAHERCYALCESSRNNRDSFGMTERELECMRWVAAGKTDWEIGIILNLSASTVRFHVDHARIKLDARTRPQAVAQVMLRGLL